MNIIGRKNWYFGLSLLFLIPGIIAIFLWGLNLSIDFTGGSRLTLSFDTIVNSSEVQLVGEVLKAGKIKVASIEKSNKSIFIRTSPMDQSQNNKFVSILSEKFKDVKEQEFETIGPVIGQETTWNALKAVGIASILIIFYITWSFRQVPKPASSFKFGICAIIALIHDVLIVVGSFAIFGHFLGVEVDSLFVTAILTIIGFSVHDTIVVFDRIRENLKKMGGADFSKTFNESIMQTIDRSLNTSLTVFLVLVALLLFGGESIRWFVVALLIGITVGTYSSIFIASPLLVVWEAWDRKRIKIK
ncbi:MAG: protein-export membrane protein SecF [Candidatus Levybacteria bacterium RIFCSPLOWO2_12_FULL_37_14]|nr:MAG: Protein translocase subunit SecF [Parcubacteria group bacterium GW2011_GWC1_36_9]KKQ28846.1 MAG: Protein translocase subunit SecF [Candidatus Levybacteria bacterium GW2011_GWA1_37_16]KKQ37945.1 MAG: Protein translocase subunit SecF [Candidatus Levybacteria bacterium GW2011_GWC2_37_7]KKQ42016.1 MAG: Protein translocase subunit SecF [Candidatus Levybacteria bacterium GW2011_GWB1_37_8]OGH49815.1 MAG: protein-export membrane protein SecF [Candidatus Levybacteria bacterium RIFCSPLOWO2_12_FUL